MSGRISRKMISEGNWLTVAIATRLSRPLSFRWLPIDIYFDIGKQRY